MRNYQDPAYKLFRETVRKRDKYRCRMPGCGAKKHLQVHHIRPWSKNISLRYDPSNGICLCRSCHKKITGHEHLYAATFQEIIHG